MSSFFHGWRRKIGCVTLVMAAAVTCAWTRSDVIADFLIVDFGTVGYRIRSLDGLLKFIHCSHPVEDPCVHWGYCPVSKLLPGRQSDQIRIVAFSFPHFVFAVPLTLLSAYLLLCPGKRPERKAKAPVEDK